MKVYLLNSKEKIYQQFFRNYLVSANKTLYLCNPKPKGISLERSGEEFLEMLERRVLNQGGKRVVILLDFFGSSPYLVRVISPGDTKKRQKE